MYRSLRRLNVYLWGAPRISSTFTASSVPTPHPPPSWLEDTIKGFTVINNFVMCLEPLEPHAWILEEEVFRTRKSRKERILGTIAL